MNFEREKLDLSYRGGQTGDLGPGYTNMIRNWPVWLGGAVRVRAEFDRINS